MQEGDGFAAATLDELGSGPGFRKLRAALGITSFGVNGMVLAPGQVNRWHWHDRQEELYFVHAGELTIELEDTEPLVLGPGGMARIAPHVVRRLANRGDIECTILALGGADGYVGRDGRLTDEELARLAEEQRAGFEG